MGQQPSACRRHCLQAVCVCIPFYDHTQRSSSPPFPPHPPCRVQAGRSIESIFAELAAAGLARSPAPATVDQFLGGDRLLKLADIPKAEPPPQQPIKSKTGGKKANAAAAGSKAATGSGGSKAASKAGKVGSSGKGGEAAGDGAEAGELKEYPEPSLAEARQAVVASCILPLGAHPALSK